MQLADKPVLQSYHRLDYDWTPLSQNPCCVTADHAFVYKRLPGFSYVTLVEHLLFQPVPCVAIMAITTLVQPPGKQILCRWLCFGTRHCKHESSPCATICWGLTCASKIFHFLSPLLLHSFTFPYFQLFYFHCYLTCLHACMQCNQTTHKYFQPWVNAWVAYSLLHYALVVACCLLQVYNSTQDHMHCPAYILNNQPCQAQTNNM